MSTAHWMSVVGGFVSGTMGSSTRGVEVGGRWAVAGIAGGGGGSANSDEFQDEPGYKQRKEEFTFRDWSELDQTPLCSTARGLNPNFVNSICGVSFYFHGICTRSQPSLAFPCSKIKIISNDSAEVSTEMDVLLDIVFHLPMPRTDCDDTRLAFFDFGMREVCPQVRTA